jgi:hypothetical protein
MPCWTVHQADVAKSGLKPSQLGSSDTLGTCTCPTACDIKNSTAMQSQQKTMQNQKSEASSLLLPLALFVRLLYMLWHLRLPPFPISLLDRLFVILARGFVSLLTQAAAAALQPILSPAVTPAAAAIAVTVTIIITAAAAATAVIILALRRPLLLLLLLLLLFAADIISSSVTSVITSSK